MAPSSRGEQPQATLNAFVTLVTSDSYLPGALVAIHSLIDVEEPSAEWETVCLVTPASVSVETIRTLRQSFSLVVGVEGIRTSSTRELDLLGRPDLRYALTKLHLWRLVQFRRIIYLDADTLVLRPLSHLFQLDVDFAAAPDQGWPDCFNTGVMVCTPNAETFDAILDLNAKGGSWDGADQGLLNDFYQDKWHRLPFTYNTTPSAFYQFKPAYRRHGSDISVVHFIGQDKPWHVLNRSRSLPSSSNQSTNDYSGLVDKWFDIYEKHFGQISTAAVHDVARPHSSTSAFVVPTLASTWDASSGRQLAYRAPSVEQLKSMFGGRVSGLGTAFASRDMPEGLYASMPLLGRPDLLSSLEPPAPEPVREPSPTHEEQHKSPSPPPGVWNATQGPPPHDYRLAPGEMRDGLPQAYENAWDPGAQPGGFFQPPRYAPPPESVKGWYQSTPSDPAAVKAVFPWEQSGEIHRASRRFPSEPPPPGRSLSPRPTSPTNASDRLQFANAWDGISGIKKYVDLLNNTGNGQAGGQPRESSSPRGSSRPLSPSATGNRGHGPKRTSQDLGDYISSGRSARVRMDSHGDLSSQDGDDEDDDEDGTPLAVNPPRKPRRPSAPQPLDGPARAAGFRPHIRRNDGSIGSDTRLPTIGGLTALVDQSAAGVSPEHKTDLPLPVGDIKKQHSGPRRGSAQLDRNGPTPATEGPAFAASRYFDPATSSDIIKQEGLESLQRFVRSMEQKGEAAKAATNNHR